MRVPSPLIAGVSKLLYTPAKSGISYSFVRTRPFPACGASTEY